MILLADALRNTLQDLDQAIQHARTCIRTDSPRKAEFLSKYRRLIRFVHELREEGVAEGATGELWAPAMPLSFNGQIMGLLKLSRQEQIARQWAGFTLPQFSKPAAKSLKRAA